MSDFEVEKAILVSLLGPANEPQAGFNVIIGWGPRVRDRCNTISLCHGYHKHSRGSFYQGRADDLHGWLLLTPDRGYWPPTDFATVVKVVSSPEFREKHGLPALESDDG